ncbi:hypothetical protein [Nocardioides sp. R-C-SC26]|uniref:hypothetical protein n=1 Tax=Nocardioides sp. R-C-SC26 TaxID=2870414 RepID=UPI001E2BE3AC|nr:hypothetical protein [Nocardioides sp. R-C-SC26]
MSRRVIVRGLSLTGELAAVGLAVAEAQAAASAAGVSAGQAASSVDELVALIESAAEAAAEQAASQVTEQLEDQVAAAQAIRTQTEADAAAAGSAATSSAGSATAAAGSAGTAAGHATAAGNSAIAAAGSATAAATSQGAAADSVTAAQGAATAASSSASAASGSAVTAAGAADTAVAGAVSAGSAATAAGGFATDASTSATNAAGSATAAAQALLDAEAARDAAEGWITGFDIGTVTTLAPGGSATAEIVGPAGAKLLNLALPQGLPGSGNVNTVNGVPGPDVVLTAANVGARADTWTPSWSEVSGKPSTFAPSAHQHSADDITSGNLAAARIADGSLPVAKVTNLATLLAEKLTASSALNAALLTGTLPTSVLPALAINETFTVANQAAMLALTAQRGDMAIREDNGRSYVLSTDSPGTLADWKQILAAGQVQSVNGETGVVSLTKSHVGLSLVDNTADLSKPISTATQTALNGKSNTGHTHAASAIDSGTLDIARIPVGATTTTVARGDRGMPTGGSTGQVLRKVSGTDYAVEWGNPTAGVASIASFEINPGTAGSASIGTGLSWWTNPSALSVVVPANGIVVVAFDMWVEVPSGTYLSLVIKKYSNGDELGNYCRVVTGPYIGRVSVRHRITGLTPGSDTWAPHLISSTGTSTVRWGGAGASSYGPLIAHVTSA